MRHKLEICVDGLTTAEASEKLQEFIRSLRMVDNGITAMGAIFEDIDTESIEDLENEQWIEELSDSGSDSDSDEDDHPDRA